MGKWRGTICWLLAIAGGACLSTASAQTPQPTLVPKPVVERQEFQTPPITAERPGAHALTSEDLNAWLDGFMPIAIGKADIPGAVVVIVKDGQILASRGYGFADVKKRKAVDPATTMFRPGSVSKLLTWTAVMQQVEQGKLDLDTDVNKYLDFKIPPYRGKPITLRNLMTHTPGFEEQVRDIIVVDQKKYVPFDQLLKRWTPKRVYDPGTTPAYSNYGASLAAYLVQRVSGEPFDAYVDRHILAPLGMRHSTFRQPLPTNLKPFMAEGYQSGKDEPFGYEYIGPGPAGSLSASGEDMARFMIAHLQNGGALLQPRTAAMMHSTISTPIPGLHGMALGFYQTDINGRRVIAHAGDTVAFHSDLELFLDEGVGLFVSFNSAGKEGAAGDLRTALFQNFADRYFPGPEDRRKLDAKAARANAEKLAGTWSTTRRSFSNFLSITDLISQTKVSVGKDGELVVPALTGLDGQPRKWVAVGPMLWRDADNHEMLGARVVDGKPVLFSVGQLAPIIEFYPTPWYQDSAWLLPLLYLSLAVLTLTAILWPVRALVRRRYSASLELERRDLIAYRASRIAAVAILATLIGWVIAISMMFGDLNYLSSSFVPVITALQLLSIIAFIGGLAAMLWYAWTVWRRKSGWKAKSWSVLLVIAALAIVWVGLSYHLIGLTPDF